MTDNELKHLPPQNLEAEQFVLGAVLYENDALGKVVDVLRSDDFYATKHRHIYAAMLSMREREEAIDLITLSDALRTKGLIEKTGGATYLSELVSLVPTSANIVYHARLVATAAQLRAIDNACADAKGGVYTGKTPDEVITSLVDKLNDARRYKSSDIITCKDIMRTGFTAIENRYTMAQDGKIAGIPTGHRDLDRKLFGFTPQFYLLSGAPSMGKSALAAGFVHAAATHFKNERDEGKGRPSAGVVSLEMSDVQIAFRMISSLSSVPLSRLLAGTIHDNDWGKLQMAAGIASELPIHYEFMSFFDTQMERTIDYMAQVLGVKFITVDYLQRGRCENHKGTREQEVSNISSMLARKVKQHNIPIVVISSINRGLANRPEKKPTMSDLRESGQIEFDADVIMFVYRDEVYNKCACPPGPKQYCTCGRRGKAEILIEKGRMEGTGTVELEWRTNVTTFVDAEEQTR